MRPTRSVVLTLAMLTLLLLVTAGCSRAPGGIAASNIPLSQGGYTVIGPASATDCKVNLLGLIPVSGGNQLQDAVRNAIRNSGGDALIDISVDVAFKYFILWSQTCTEVRATAVRVP